MIQITITIKNNSCNTCLERILGNQLSYFLRLFLLRHSFHTQRRGSSQCFTRVIVYQLYVNLLVTSKNRHTRTSRSTGDLAPNSIFDFKSSFYFRNHTLSFILLFCTC